jgi:cytochrome c oxidase cbb3-type subunit 3
VAELKKSRVLASTGLYWRRGILLLLVCLAPLISVRGRSDEAPKDKSVQRGHDRFERSCAMCHGAAATGGAGPNLIQSSLVRHDEGGDQIGPVVWKGRSERGMPAFPTLTAGDISDLAAFLQRLIVTASVASSNGLAGDNSLKNLLTGNAAKGKQYFYGAGGCSPCHSPAGDLSGVARRYSPTELEGRILYPSGQSVTATVSLGSGEKSEGKLLHLDEFYVAIEDANGSYRSWPLAQVKVEVKNPLAAHQDLLGKYTDEDIHDLFAYLETFQ